MKMPDGRIIVGILEHVKELKPAQEPEKAPVAEPVQDEKPKTVKKPAKKKK
jgi:hypothetical protein